MLTHFVVFWLKEDLSPNDRDKFFEGVQSLASIEGVEKTYIGTPADTPKRPVVDDSYDCALTVLLKDMNAHDTYQTDPIHLDFIKQCSNFWRKVQIFDAD